jgi:hypothetical protein
MVALLEKEELSDSYERDMNELFNEKSCLCCKDWYVPCNDPTHQSKTLCVFCNINMHIVGDCDGRYDPR